MRFPHAFDVNSRPLLCIENPQVLIRSAQLITSVRHDQRRRQLGTWRTHDRETMIKQVLRIEASLHRSEPLEGPGGNARLDTMPTRLTFDVAEMPSVGRSSSGATGCSTSWCKHKGDDRSQRPLTCPHWPTMSGLCSRAAFSSRGPRAISDAWATSSHTCAST